MRSRCAPRPDAAAGGEGPGLQRARKRPGTAALVAGGVADRGAGLVSGRVCGQVCGLLAGLVAGLLAGCATPPAPRDGPPARIPPGLERVPDATPRVEPIRLIGANKPYEVFGVRYAPLATDAPVQEQGLASWYGTRFHGKPTSNGEVYDMFAMTAAHKTMPIPSYARVRNPANGREIIVRINDRGPFASGRIIDLSYTAALKLDLLRGVAPVQVRRITHDEIRVADRAPRTEALMRADADRARSLLEGLDP